LLGPTIAVFVNQRPDIERKLFRAVLEFAEQLIEPLGINWLFCLAEFPAHRDGPCKEFVGACERLKARKYFFKVKFEKVLNETRGNR